MRYIYLVAILIFGCSTKDRPLNGSELKADSIKLLTGKRINCDSIFKNHFVNLKFPFERLDSINETEIDPRHYLQFQPCDNLLFDNDRSDIQIYSYISLQDTTDYYSVLVYRQMDMENCLFIFSFDKENNRIDSEILFCNGGGIDRQSDVLINGKIVNTLKEEKKAIFIDNKFISSYKEFYSLLDTVTNSKIKEIGRQKIIEYQIDKSGRFKKTKDNSFEKEYSKIKYWYN